VITDCQGNEVDETVALNRVVAALDLRLHNETSSQGKLNRLLEEIGGLAACIVVLEDDVLWTSADDRPTPLSANDLRDVLCAIGRVAHHHEVRLRLPDADDHQGARTPYVLLALLTQAGGALAEAVRLVIAARKKDEGNRALTFDRLVWAVDNAAARMLALAGHYGLCEELRLSVQTAYQEHQRAGFLKGGPSDGS